MPYFDPHTLGLKVARQSGDEVMVFCPYHHDRHPSASFNVRKGLFYCFTCGASKLVTQLAADLGGEVTDVHFEDPGWKFPVLEEDYDDWSGFLGYPLAKDNDYLTSRYVTNYQVETHGLRDYNGKGIIVPLHDLKRTTGVIIRQFERDPKYLIIGKRPPVWPMQILPNLSSTKHVFIVEGVFGVLRAENFGRVALATLGTSGVDNAIKLVQSNPGLLADKVIGLTDTDLPGRIAAVKMIAAGIPVVYSHKRDPDEWNDRHWNHLFSRLDDLTTTDMYELSRTIKAADLEPFWEAVKRIRRSKLYV